MKKNITREDVLGQAVEDCYREMFAKAQPEADWDNLIAEYKAGKIDEEKDGPIYDRHYLSYDEYVYIIDKYLSAYKIESEWKEDIGILEDYLNEGGSKDKYIESYTDENGDYHPGYRGYEKVPALKDQIKEYFEKNICVGPGGDIYKNVEDIIKIVMNDIATCKDFYNFNMDEMKFRNTLAFGSTPTSNPETVKKWWKEHYNVDIEIEERNPKLFWYLDHGYTDEDLEDEFGENWKEKLDKEWKDEIKAKEAEFQKKIEELKNQNNEE